MAFEKRDMSGALFKNTKQMNDKSPTHTGTIMIDGVEYWQSAWVKESSSGVKFFSQSFKRKDEAPPSRQETSRRQDPVDDDIPF